MMRCAFEDEYGFCHGPYRGFKCIGEKCKIYGKFIVPEGLCAYYRDGYCKKMKTFNCDGKNTDCPYYRTYVENEEIVFL